MHDFEKPKHTQTRHSSATTRYRPWRSRCARVKRKLLGKWPGGLPHLRELLLFCACVRGGANLRPNLETTPEEEILRPISACDRDETPLFGGFSDPVNCHNQHSSPHAAVYTNLTVGESCIDQDLWPASGLP